jgi:hypothetical protein
MSNQIEKRLLEIKLYNDLLTTSSHKKTCVFGTITFDVRQLFRQYGTFDQYFFISYLRELKGKFHKLRATTEVKQEIVSIAYLLVAVTVIPLMFCFNFMKQDYIKYHHCIRYYSVSICITITNIIKK